MDLTKFNQAQREAITYPLEPLMVMAGAGTGKTTVLTSRVLYLLETFQIPAYRILAITFTNKAANEMNERIQSRVGTPLEWIGTFHSICIRILRREIHFLNRNNNFKIIDDEEQTTILKDIYEGLNIKPSFLSYKNALYIIDQIKSHQYDQKDILNPKIFMKWNLNSSEAVMVNEIYLRYLKKLEIYNYLDFNDLLIFTDYILTHFREAYEYWSNRFSYVLVDEFQDTNDIQYRLIKILGGKNFMVFAVGDEDQTIYTFRGANPKIINEFLYENNREIKVIKLEENYRSSQQILNVANQLISKNKDRIEKNLFSSYLNGVKPDFFLADNEEEEASFVARKINDLIYNEHVFLKDIAVLYRSNYISRSFEQALIFEGIRYNLYGGFKFYQRTEIKDMLSYLTAVQNNDELALRRIINVPRRKISDTTVKEVIDYAEHHNLSFWDALNEGDNIASLTAAQKQAIRNFVSLMYSFKNTEHNSIVELYDAILEKTKYLEYCESRDTKSKNNVSSYLDEFRNGILSYQEKNQADWSLDNYLQEIALFTSSDDKKRNENAVSLMTVHSAKGLEFRYVFLVSFSDGIFPSVHSIEENNLSEERRLAYVGITRAKQRLWITANQGYMFQKKMKRTVSRFLLEVSANNLNRINNKIVIKSNLDLEWYDSKKSNVINKEEKFHKKTMVNDYKVGDKVVHTTFGLGTVVEVSAEILDISFPPPYNLKRIMYNHKALKRHLK